MRMNAIPVFTGSALRSWVKASSPPADAPTPTMGKVGRLDLAGGFGTRERSIFFDCDELFPFGPMGPSPPTRPDRVCAAHSIGRVTRLVQTAAGCPAPGCRPSPTYAAEMARIRVQRYARVRAPCQRGNPESS